MGLLLLPGWADLLELVAGRHRRWVHQSCEQLVLPKNCHPIMLCLTHDVLTAGQLGITLIVKLKSADLGESTALLGHTLEGGKLQPDLRKVQAGKEYPRPFTKKYVLAFLHGLVGYYRQFVSQFERLCGKRDPFLNSRNLYT